MILKDPMLWRLVWKEYRAQRNFWLVIAGFGIALMLAFMALLDPEFGRWNAPWAIALALPAAYALGSGAVLFASEQEEGTADFLRILPTRTTRLFLAKVGFTLVSTLALTGLLLLSAALLTRGHRSDLAPYVAERVLFGTGMMLVVVEWSILASAGSRKVLAAVCLAAVAASTSVAVIRANSELQLHPESVSFFLQLALAVPLLGLSYVLLRQQMAGRTYELSLPRWVQRKTAAVKKLDRLAACRETHPAWQRSFRRLVWIEFRHALSPGHVLWIGGIVLSLLAISLPTGRLEWHQTFSGIFLFPTLIGVWAFQTEGGRRTRFLAELGLSPHTLWLSKQLVWVGLTAVVTIPFLVVVEIVNRESVQGQTAPTSMFHPDVPGASALLFAVALACVGYAAGQFASMLVPRGVTAGFVGFAIFTLLVFWTWLMVAAQVPLSLSVAPLVIFLLAATLIWSRRWLLESATWRSWLRLGAAGVALLVLVWGGVGAYRVLEVPALEEILQSRRFVEPHPFHPASASPITSAEQETAQMYHRARSEYTWRQGRPWESDNLGKTAHDGWEFAREEERRLLVENQQALETALAATVRPACAFTDAFRPPTEMFFRTGAGDFSELVNLILLSARALESEGKLDEALERYIAVLRLGRHVASRGPTFQWQTGASIERTVADWMPLWAAHPGQSPERIEAGARRLREELNRFPPLIEAVLVERQWFRSLIDSDWSERLAELNREGGNSARFAASVLDRCCPWERHRARRVLDLVYFSQLNYAAAAEHSLATPATDPAALLQRPPVIPPTSAPGADSRSEGIPWKWARTTFPWFDSLPHDETFIVHLRLLRELPLRVLSLRLALAAWKSRHGEYPARLDELPDAGTTATIDPFTGYEFGYRPQGFPNSVRFIDATSYRENIVPAGHRVLWSAGPFNVRVVPIRRSADISPEFVGVYANGQSIDERQAKHVGAYAFTLP